MIALTPTPSIAAGLAEVDTTEPKIRTRTAIGVITAGYLLFFGIGVFNAIYVAWNDIVLPATDYSAFSGVSDALRRLFGIGGAVMILYLVTRWLQIDRALAGVPKYPAPPRPALYTIGIAIAGLILSGIVFDMLQTDPDGDPNAAGGGVEPNPWAALSLIGDLNAGVVEEIIIVAVPVLVGRRAGWHPASIIGLSVLLRWPFHIYHGALTSLPWAMIWGGAYVAAFLYLRRLWPLVMLHFLNDAMVDMGSAYGNTGRWAVALLGGACVAFLLWRSIIDQKRRLNSNVASLATEPEARKYLHQLRTTTDKLSSWALTVLVVFGLPALLVAAVLTGLDLTDAIVIGLGALAVVGICWWAATSIHNATNVIIRRNDDGAIDGVIRWHTTYTGRSSIDTITDDIDILDAIGEIAHRDHQPVTLSRGDKTRQQRLADVGLYRATGWWRSPWIHIPPDRAVKMTAEASVSATDHAENAATTNPRPED